MDRKSRLRWSAALAGVAALAFAVGDRLSALAPEGSLPVVDALTRECLAALPGSLVESPLWLSLDKADMMCGAVVALPVLVAWVVVMATPHADRSEDAYGSERRGTVRDLARYANVERPADNIVLSRHGLVSLTGAGTPPDRKGARVKTANSNVMVIGGSGAQKTTSVLEPNLLQGALGSDKDTVSTDPKGATLPRVGRALVEGGRQPVKLDLVDPSQSSVWNPLEVIRSYTDVERVAKALVAGASEGGHSTSEPIWDNGAAMLAAILISYLWAWCPRSSLTMSELQRVLGWCEFGKGQCKFDKAINEIETGKAAAPAREEVGAGAAPASLVPSKKWRSVECLGVPAGVMAGLKARCDAKGVPLKDAPANEENPGAPVYDYTVAAWKRFRGGAAETLGSFKATLSQAIAPFCSPEVLRMLGSENGGVDEIGLERLGLGDARRDVFVVASDRDHSLQAVLSLFVWEAMYASGRNADAQPDKRLPHHVQFLIDELYALGELPDLPENVVTVRSRNISILGCLQNLAQLDERYGENGAKTIRDSCATTVYLAGAKSADTAKRLEEELGQMTIHKSSESMRGQGLPGKDVSQDVLGRAVWTAQEISRMPKDRALVMIGTEYAVQDEKYRVWEHPRYDPRAMFDPNGARPADWGLFDYRAWRETQEGTSEHAARERRLERARTRENEEHAARLASACEKANKARGGEGRRRGPKPARPQKGGGGAPAE